MAGNKDTIVFQNNIIARMREEAAAQGVVGYVVKINEKDTVLVTGVEVPLRPKYVEVPTPKFGGKKRKNSNSGGTGRAGRRKKRPSVPTGRL